MKSQSNWSLKAYLEDLEVIRMECNDWFSMLIEKEFNWSLKAYLGNMPSLRDAFEAGWFARKRCDPIQSLDGLISKLENQSFDGWSLEEKNAYSTALISMKEHINKSRYIHIEDIEEKVD